MDQEERQLRKRTSMEEVQQRNNQSMDTQDDQANVDNHHVISPEVVEYLNSFPPGYRFLPTDEELVDHYLWKKVKNEPLPPNMIHDVHLYKHEPDTLAEEYTPAERYPPAENMWYFFTPRDRKYMNGERPNRGTPNGFWKATGADKPIKSNGIEVGSKKALVHYLGKPSHGVKTPWIMHEFKANNAPPPSRRGTGQVKERMRLDDWVLCRIHKKGGKVNKTDCDRNHGNVSDSVSYTCDPTPVQSPRTNGFPPTNAAVSERSPLVPVSEVHSLALQASQPYVRPSQVARNPPAHKMRRSQPYVHSMPLAHDHPSTNKVSSKQPKRSQPYVLHSPLAHDHLPHVQSSLLAQNPPAEELPFVMPEKSQSYCLPETPDPNRFPTMMPRYAQFHGLSAPIQVPIKQETLPMTPHSSSSSSSVSSTQFQSSPAAFPSLQMPENNQSSDYLDYSCNNFDQDFFGYQYNNYDSYFGNNSLNYEEPHYSHNLSSYVEGFDFEPVRTGAPISSMASVSIHENTCSDQVNYDDLSTTAFTRDE